MTTSPKQSQKTIAEWKRARGIVVRVLVALVVGGLLATLCYGATLSWSAALRYPVWSLGLLVTGLFVGFLFGLPRDRDLRIQKPPPNEGESADTGTEATVITARRYVPDGMLEVADWLTKIIAGLGLVNLREVPRLMTALADAIVGDERVLYSNPLCMLLRSFGFYDYSDDSQHSFALAMGVYFPIVGLSLGYIVTRCFLQAALLQGDREAEQVSQGPLATPQLERKLVEGEQAAMSVAEGRMLPADGEDPSRETADRLAALNQDYCNVHVPDYRERVRTKDQLAEQMYRLAVEHNVPKDWLARRTGDGYVAILALQALASPAPEDVNALLRAGPHAQMKHTKFKVAQAILKLWEAQLLDEERTPPVVSLLKSYLLDAEPDAPPVALRIGTIGLDSRCPELLANGVDWQMRRG